MHWRKERRKLGDGGRSRRMNWRGGSWAKAKEADFGFDVETEEEVAAAAAVVVVGVATAEEVVVVDSTGEADS